MSLHSRSSKLELPPLPPLVPNRRQQHAPAQQTPLSISTMFEALFETIPSHITLDHRPRTRDEGRKRSHDDGTHSHHDQRSDGVEVGGEDQEGGKEEDLVDVSNKQYVGSVPLAVAAADQASSSLQRAGVPSVQQCRVLLQPATDTQGKKKTSGSAKTRRKKKTKQDEAGEGEAKEGGIEDEQCEEEEEDDEEAEEDAQEASSCQKFQLILNDDATMRNLLRGYAHGTSAESGGDDDDEEDDEEEEELKANKAQTGESNNAAAMMMATKAQVDISKYMHLLQPNDGRIHTGVCVLFQPERGFGFISPNIFNDEGQRVPLGDVFVNRDCIRILNPGVAFHIHEEKLTHKSLYRPYFKAMVGLCAGEDVEFLVTFNNGAGRGGGGGGDKRRVKGIEVRGAGNTPVLLHQPQKRCVGVIRHYSAEREFGFIVRIATGDGSSDGVAPGGGGPADDVFFHSSSVAWTGKVDKPVLEEGFVVEYTPVERLTRRRAEQQSDVGTAAGGSAAGGSTSKFVAMGITDANFKPLNPQTVRRREKQRGGGDGQEGQYGVAGERGTGLASPGSFQSSGGAQQPSGLSGGLSGGGGGGGGVGGLGGGSLAGTGLQDVDYSSSGGLLLLGGDESARKKHRSDEATAELLNEITNPTMGGPGIGGGGSAGSGSGILGGAPPSMMAMMGTSPTQHFGAGAPGGFRGAAASGRGAGAGGRSKVNESGGDHGKLIVEGDDDDNFANW